MSLNTEDAKTLAIWCARSGDGYNTGAWQASLLLGTAEFRRLVAEHIATLGLPADHPAVRTWARELEAPPS